MTQKKINVLWKTYEPDTIARGYWDQGLLEDLLAGKWSIPGWYEFVHYEGDFNHIPKGEGAVVVVPARHNVNHIEQLNNDLARLPWSLLILTGDEESVFPYEEIESGRPMKMWLMSPKPGVHPSDPRIQYLGSGYPPQAREELRKTYGLERNLSFFFSGQNTHQRRLDALDAMKKFPGGLSNATEGFTQGMDPEEYYRNMARAKLAPCPSGPVSVDSFRLYEALEAGCIPIADGRTPEEDMSEHWTMVFGGPPEFPVIDNWDKFERFEAMLPRFHPIANKIGSWWELKKRDLAIRMYQDLQFLGKQPAVESVANDLSIVVVSSPIGDHPDMTHIDIAMESIRSRDEIKDCEVFILCDGVRPEQEHYRERYEEYVSRLLWRARNEWTNVYPIVFEEHTHQARMTREFIQRGIMRTELMAFVEHDTSFEGEIPFRVCCDMILDDEADMVRFHHETFVHPEHQHLFGPLDDPVLYKGERFLDTDQWSQRPHIASVAFYERNLLDHFSHNSRTMIEDTMHGVAQNPDWEGRMRLYYPAGNCKRSTTSDGRQADPKYDMFG